MGKAFAKALFKADHSFPYLQLQRDSGGLSIQNKLKSNWSSKKYVPLIPWEIRYQKLRDWCSCYITYPIPSCLTLLLQLVPINTLFKFLLVGSSRLLTTVVLGGERGVMKCQMWGADIPNNPNTEVFNAVQDSAPRSIDVWMSKHVSALWGTLPKYKSKLQANGNQKSSMSVFLWHIPLDILPVSTWNAGSQHSDLWRNPASMSLSCCYVIYASYPHPLLCGNCRVPCDPLQSIVSKQQNMVLTQTLRIGFAILVYMYGGCIFLCRHIFYRAYGIVNCSPSNGCSQNPAPVLLWVATMVSHQVI